MARTKGAVSFHTTLTRPSDEWGWYFLPVESSVAARFDFDKGSKRVICTVNGTETFQCALMPWGEIFYIIVSKDKRKRLGIETGDEVFVELVKDESKYGLPMPEELQEVLNQDPEGDRLFHNLTPGRQRNILYWVGKIKDVDRRIHDALIFIEHLRRNDGKIDSKALQQELKRPSF